MLTGMLNLIVSLPQRTFMWAFKMSILTAKLLNAAFIYLVLASCCIFVVCLHSYDLSWVTILHFMCNCYNFLISVWPLTLFLIHIYIHTHTHSNRSSASDRFVCRCWNDRARITKRIAKWSIRFFFSRCLLLTLILIISTLVGGNKIWKDKVFVENKY